MFRDLYKTAFDEITPSNELLERILSAQEIKKKHSLRNIYSYCSVAAAVFLVAISVYLYPHFQDIDTPKTQDFNNVENIVPDIKDDTAKIEADNPIAVNPEISQPSQQTPAPINPGVTEEPNNKEASENIAGNITADEIIPEVTAPVPQAYEENVAEPESSDDTLAMKSMPEDSQMRAFGAGMDAGISYKLFTSEEYCKYLGLDIQKIADIPKSLVLTSTKEMELAVDENGKFISDEWTYIYEENENRQIFITTTRFISGLEELIRNEGAKDINGSKYITFDYGDSKTVYLIRQDIGITVSGFGITQGELDRLIASLTK